MPGPARLLAVLAILAFAGCGGAGDTPTAPRASGVDAWRAGPPAVEPLTEVAAAAHEGRIWVAGGLAADGRAVSTVQVLDPASGSWSTDVPLREPIHHAALVSDGDALYLLGGYGATGRPSASVYIRAGGAWDEAVPLPEPRGAGAAAWDGDGRIVYAGGVGPDGVSDEAWALADHAWEPYGRLPDPLEHLAAASDGAGAVYVVGGRAGGLDTNSARASVIDEAGGRRLGELSTRRGGVAAFWWPSLGACLVGGESPGGTHAEVECIAPDGRVTSLPDLARPRHGLGAVIVDDRAYVLLGGERPGLFVSDAVEVLDLP